MKHTRLALVLVATSLATTPAIAASLTMLQFGSFETRAEAEKRLSDISKKHAAVVAKLGSTIREVKLPPDNLTVYRTQAGPLENRAAAQAVCAVLSSAGDECYIVQTAMVASADLVKPVGDVSPAPADSVVADATKAVAEVKTELAQATPLKEDLTSKLSTLTQPTPRDVSNLKALESVAVPELGKVDMPVVAAQPTSEMKLALDQAVDEQPAAEASVKAATAKVEQKARPSFWSRLNPFGSDNKKTQPLAVVKDPLEVAAPVEAVTSQSVEAPVVTVTEPVVEAPSVVQKPVVTASTITTEKPMMPTISAAESSAATIDTTPVITQMEPMRLPPPPAPLKARDREILAAARDAQLVASAPMQIGSTPVVDPKPLQPSIGNVQVEEAKRVPVTSTTASQSLQPSQAVTVPVVAPSQPAVPLNPSATEGMKTVWAQIGPFSDNDAALAYWANYRKNNPDFPVVRVRVTTPLAQQVRGSSESWLRVGPVTRAAFVKVLCASVVTPTGKLRCGTVSDMGVSSVSKPMPGMLPSSRYSR